MVIQIVSVFIPFLLPEHRSHVILSFQGFDDVAAMVIHNFEVRTGHVVSMAELESGYLKGQLCPKDYDIKQGVGLFHTQKLWQDNS